MKTAYELAMERLGKSEPIKKLSDDQKKRLAELDAEYKAKLADRELASKAQLETARSQGDVEALDRLEKQLAGERRSLQAELEKKKETIRQES